MNDNLVTGFWWLFSKLVNLMTIWWGNYIKFDKVTDVMSTSFWLQSDNFSSKTSRDEAKLVVFVAVILTTQSLSSWRPKTCQLDNYLTTYWRLLNDNFMTSFWRLFSKLVNWTTIWWDIYMNICDHFMTSPWQPWQPWWGKTCYFSRRHFNNLKVVNMTTFWQACDQAIFCV